MIPMETRTEDKSSQPIREGDVLDKKCEKVDKKALAASKKAKEEAIKNNQTVRKDEQDCD
jgi:hypothetical protein